VSRTYYFKDDVPPNYIYSHLLVCASKFAMPPTSHSIKGSYPTFELPNETLHLIEEALGNLRRLDFSMCGCPYNMPHQSRKHMYQESTHDL
jgi:hypothetical protein